MAWKNVFEQAGLKLVHEQVQDGLPAGLYVVKMYARRVSPIQILMCFRYALR
jgi:protein N-terminal methyltransferase